MVLGGHFVFWVLGHQRTAVSPRLTEQYTVEGRLYYGPTFPGV